MSRANKPTLCWKNGAVFLLDQTRLPQHARLLVIRTVKAMWQAIKRLAVRGAPAIGCAAAYGVLLGIRRQPRFAFEIISDVQRAAEYLATSRPTAINLFWALARMRRVAQDNSSLPPNALRRRLLAEAHSIYREDQNTCAAIGKYGAELISPTQKPFGILTHCNAGRLATAGIGTALAVIYTAQAQGKNIHVYADETRPLLQGARLTMWELTAAKVKATLICDNMAAQVMREGRVQMVVVGADRIAANGDTANKIGTYGVAVLARHHRIPFYVAAPLSTFDLSISDGSRIPIEQRSGDEVRRLGGKFMAPREVEVYNPAFDVTPAKLISGIITERGVIHRPTAEKIRRFCACRRRNAYGARCARMPYSIW